MTKPDDLSTLHQYVRSLAVALSIDYEDIALSDADVKRSDELDETQLRGPVREGRDETRIENNGKDLRSEQESTYYSSYSEESRASGHDMILQRRLPFGTE